MDREERDRITAEYGRRTADARLRALYSRTDPAVLFMRHDFERRLVALLDRSGLLPLAGLRVLDVGCGGGALLRQLQELGASPGGLLGIDIGLRQLAVAQEAAPHHRFAQADAAALPFSDGSFDLVCQVVLVSSVLKQVNREEVVREMQRVMRPSGSILWYDFIWNPLNPQTRGVDLSELGRLFPGCSIDMVRTTLAPPAARLLAGRSRLLAELLAAVPWFSSHLLAVIRPRS